MLRPYAGMSLSDESKLKRGLSERDKNKIKKRFWRYIFIGAKKLRITSDDELGKIIKIKPSQIGIWRKNPNKTVPFYHSNHYKGIAAESFTELIVNLQNSHGSLSRVNAWLRTPSFTWGGKTPLEYIKDDPYGVYQVNRYLKEIGG